MAKTKKDLLEEAKALGIEVDAKSKIAEIQALIDGKAPMPKQAPDLWHCSFPESC